MRKFLVCDGGGTKTDFLVFEESGNVLTSYSTSGSNPNFIGSEEAIGIVLDGINKSLEKCSLKVEDLESITLFIPGFLKCIEELKERLKVNKINCYGDIDNVFYGALGRGEGIVVLSGTGSFAVGVSSGREKVIKGGWGPLIGDKGSGYHIGIMCLEKMVYFYDNNIKNSLLRKLCLEKLKVKDEMAIRDVIYTSEFTRDKIASLSKIVAEAAYKNDIYAIEILENAAKELVDLVIMINKKFCYEKLPITLIGGVSKIGGLFINIFVDELKNKCSNLQYIDAKYEPIIGAMLYVLKEEANIDIMNEEIERRLSVVRRDKLYVNG